MGQKIDSSKIEFLPDIIGPHQTVIHVSSQVYEVGSSVINYRGINAKFDLITINSSWRGLGIGSMLLDYMIQHVRTHNKLIQRIHLQAEPFDKRRALDKTGLIQFYQSRGFSIFNSVVESFDDPIYMELQLVKEEPILYEKPE